MSETSWLALVVNDLHLTEAPPSGRLDTYFEQICRKMVEVAELSQKCEVTVFTGDLFHHKVARNVTHRTVRVLISLLKRVKNPYCILGNHDIIGGQSTTSTRQPVGVVFESGHITKLTSLVVEDVELVGLDYSQEFEDGEKVVNLPLLQHRGRIVFMHSMLSPWDDLRKKVRGPFTLVCYGHPHEREGLVNGFVNFGSLARTSRAGFDRRLVGVTLIDRELTPHEVILKNQKPWEEIFEKVATEEEEAELRGVDEFLRAIDEVVSEEGESIDKYLAGVSPEVRSRVLYYLGSL